MSVVSLSEIANNGAMRTPEQCLQDCLNDIGKRGAFKDGKKLLVLCLNEADGNYSVSWAQAGMKMSECLSLIEVSKMELLREMNYV